MVKLELSEMLLKSARYLLIISSVDERVFEEELMLELELLLKLHGRELELLLWLLAKLSLLG